MSVIKKYSATAWYCSGCIHLQGLVDSLDDDLKSIIESVDIDMVQRTELSSLKIRGVPVMIAFNDEGSEVGRLNGVPTKQVLEDFVKKYT